jgi:hypothetical protein
MLLINGDGIDANVTAKSLTLFPRLRVTCSVL